MPFGWSPSVADSTSCVGVWKRSWRKSGNPHFTPSCMISLINVCFNNGDMNHSAFENQATLDMVEELELYLTLTYLMVETQRQNSDPSGKHLFLSLYLFLSFIRVIGMLDVSFVSFLFCFLGKISDQNAKVLPVQKVRCGDEYFPKRTQVKHFLPWYK